MLPVTAILVSFGACAVVYGYSPPPYIQAKTSFLQAKLYLQENIPYEPNDIHDPLARRHFAFGMLATVTGALVEACLKDPNRYDSLAVLDVTVPEAWMNYNELASGPVNKLLVEASAKIQPITSLERLCDLTQTIEECNRVIDDKVNNGSSFLGYRAALLLQLGTVSDIILKNVPTIENVVENDQQIPYLLHNIESINYKSFVIELASAYQQLRRVSSPIKI